MTAQKKQKFALACLTLALSLGVSAADYYVAVTGNDEENEGSASSPFATIDKAIATATESADVIHVAAGTYATTTQWGPNLQAKLIGEGDTRDEVIIQSAGSYRTLRMAANSWLENVTVIGEGSKKADKGGAIEMSGGTVKNCVIKDGTAYGNGNLAGGNIYMSGGLIENCEILNGVSDKRGGNVYLDNGTIRNCRISGGTCSNVGGNVYQYNGLLIGCEIINGTSVNDGGNVRMNGNGTISDCLVSGGKITTGSEKKGANIYADSATKISRCHLSGGSTENNYNSGSLCVYSTSVVVEDTLIEGSTCGGVLLGASSHLYNCTIVNNSNDYGVWAWNTNQVLVNCVIYGNKNGDTTREWSGNQPNGSNALFLNCATSDGAMNQNAYPTLRYIFDQDFVDYANGDYHPQSSGLLEDAGAADPRGAKASTSDLDGNPRMSGTIDVGCYECQKQDMTVRIDNATFTGAIYAPSAVAFTHTTENAPTDEVLFTYDFGDGSDTVTTTESTVSHVYSTPGVYTVTITATAGEASAEMVYEGYVRVASTVVYVAADNANAAFPYNTPETGYAKLETALGESLDGYEIRICPGVYGRNDQFRVVNAVTLKGLGASPDEVVIRNTASAADSYYHRTMEVMNEGAWIENVTIADGKTKNNAGANLRITAGTVTNCVIRGGYVNGSDGSAIAFDGNSGKVTHCVIAGNRAEGGAGSAVLMKSTTILSHCVITNNVDDGTSNGGTVRFPWNAKRGQLLNCLIAGNTYVSNLGDEAKTCAVGVYFGGGNDETVIENNTIVSNTVVGLTADQSAGIYCTTWYGRLRNNVIAGNYETGLGKCTSVKIDFDHCTFIGNVTDDAQPVRTGNYAAPVSAMFRDFTKGDFAPRTDGALVNKGVTPSVTTTVDLLGNPRVFGKGIDIGCYECQKKLGLAIVLK